VKRFGITFPGFRPEKASDVERCDAIADEIRMRPPARQAVLEVLRAGLKAPAFPDASLDAALADELLEVAGSDHGLAIALWRLVADPQPEIRAKGAAALETLAAEWYGPPPEGAPEGGAAPAPARPSKGGGPGGGDEAVRQLQAQLKGAEERLSKAEARAEEQRLRGDQAREKLQAQLKEARAEAAQAKDEAARAREAAERAAAAQRSAEGALAQARATDAAAEAQRLRGALREAEVRLHAAEGDAARARERVAALEAELAAAQASAAPSSAAQAAPLPDDAEPEEAPATWLLPIFSDEFYRSLEGWDRRIQRAALKQAFLLSQDHRHPSLRALPLEGLPGYYRVRVATDVRLIYRRGERQDTVELCSLIDREDLDRYVRQAKTR
jgi:mRNA-degrading endonuclease RelE of RelBE toxin-antitoxin system